MCSSQRSQVFELATTRERLQVGGGYTVLIKKIFKSNKAEDEAIRGAYFSGRGFNRMYFVLFCLQVY